MQDYYTIHINKQVSNFADGIAVLFGEMRKLHCWERNRPIPYLQAKGYNLREIGEILGISGQAVSNYISKTMKGDETNAPSLGRSSKNV